MSKKKNSSASLLSKQAMGGIRGGKGYTFQDAYIISRLPKWLSSPNFIRFLKEGAGDVEVSYKADKRNELVYVQVKDHQVKPSEFKKVIEEFIAKDSDAPDTYKEFSLVSVGLSQYPLRLVEALGRYREASPFYNKGKDKTIKDTKESLKKLAEKVGVDSHLNFLIDKVYFDTDLSGLKQKEQLANIFVGSILKVPRYHEMFRKALEPSFNELCVLVNTSAGKTIERKTLELVIDKSLQKFRDEIKKSGLLVRMYHWENEPLEVSLPHDILLDWSNFFERKTRKIPDSSVWEQKLLPELQETQKGIRKTNLKRLIKFEGSSCLSAGIAFGWAFPEVAQYVIELNQRGDIWRSDVNVSKKKSLSQKQVVMDEKASDLLVLFSISADVEPKVNKFIKDKNLKYKAKLILQLNDGLETHINNQSALAIAREAKTVIRDVSHKLDAGKIHLFFSGPLGLSIFFGQLLNAMPDIQCYEGQIKGGYKQSCLLKSS